MASAGAISLLTRPALLLCQAPSPWLCSVRPPARRRQSTPRQPGRATGPRPHWSERLFAWLPLPAAGPAVFAAATGSLVRNQVAAIVGWLAWSHRRGSRHRRGHALQLLRGPAAAGGREHAPARPGPFPAPLQAALPGRERAVAHNLRRFAREIGAILDQVIPLFAAAFSDAELLEALRRAIASEAWSAGPFAVHPIEGYLVAEQELGRVAPDADCRSAASLILSLCHERAFLDYFAGRSGSRKSITREIDFIARAISPATAGGSGQSRTGATPRRKEQ